ncbi:hypothetical protein Sipo8835_33455 [Streptomyces ipomoeae]|uniref:Collagen triple helix repeat protein n=2 Tax=Streptomyces ipomoeae TaxID=103232 RepID=L1KTQ4_9ACTN|nr:hypothetical protein STRIP9103_06128 [Streptomyces ipomoeae 91-03]TQE24115.1 hypothetical protein Sipo7851_36600 [Streptomyces ipomoeae]TQE24662.1 hypothetical protein Sipo8835_33455 [Streptomyces ipomoeae]
MLRHEFKPGKLVAGAFLTFAGALYLGDARGAWETPWFVVIPLVIAGLCLAGVVAFLNHAIRGHRASGRRGQVGTTGLAGSTGTAGTAGSTGTAGAKGAAGSAGPTGTAGSTGPMDRGNDLGR